MGNRNLYIWSTILLLLSGCSSLDEQQYGTLELAVRLEQPISIAVSTRTVDADLQVEVWHADGATLVRQFAPGQSPNRMTLESGSYLLKAFTPNYQTTYSNSELGEAKYYKEQLFQIDANVVNRINCTVPMMNTAICFTVPEGFNTWFTDYSFSVKEQSTTRNVDLEVGETAYFDCTACSANLIYTLTTVNTDNEPHSDSGTLTATAGTLYHITYSWQTKALTWEEGNVSH